MGNGVRAKLKAENTIQVSNVGGGTQILEPLLLPPRTCTSRKLEPQAGAGSQTQALGYEI